MWSARGTEHIYICGPQEVPNTFIYAVHKRYRTHLYMRSARGTGTHLYMRSIRGTEHIYICGPQEVPNTFIYAVRKRYRTHLYMRWARGTGTHLYMRSARGTGTHLYMRSARGTRTHLYMRSARGTEHIYTCGPQEVPNTFKLCSPIRIEKPFFSDLINFTHIHKCGECGQ